MCCIGLQKKCDLFCNELQNIRIIQQKYIFWTVEMLKVQCLQDNCVLFKHGLKYTVMSYWQIGIYARMVRSLFKLTL